MRKFFYFFLLLAIVGLGAAIWMDVTEPERTNLVILAAISLIIATLFARAIRSRKKTVFYLVHDKMHDVYYITNEESFSSVAEVHDEIVATAKNKEMLQLLRDEIHFHLN